MTKDEALKLALKALETPWNAPYVDGCDLALGKKVKAITAIKETLAQPEQEPVAYDKTEMNCFVQDLYDKKMQEGKHGHYETMFHVVHQAIKRIPPQRTWVNATTWRGLTDEDFLEACQIAERGNYLVAFQRIQAKLKEKNT